MKQDLMKMAVQAGMPALVLESARTSSGRLNFKTIQNAVDKSQIVIHPMELMGLMETTIAEWAKKSSVPRKTWKQALEEAEPSARPGSVRVPHWALREAYQFVDEVEVLRQEGSHVEISAKERDALVQAAKAAFGGGASESEQRARG